MAAKVGHKLTGASLEAHVALRSSCRAEGLALRAAAAAAVAAAAVATAAAGAVGTAASRDSGGLVELLQSDLLVQDEVVPVPHVVGVQLLNKQINKYSYSIVYIVIDNIGVKFKFY